MLMLIRSIALVFGLLLARADVGLAEKQVTICHRPPGNLGNLQTISVGEAATTAHLAHGDQLGECLIVCGSCDAGDGVHDLAPA